MADEEFISIKELAVRLDMDRSLARRYVLKLGYRPVKRRARNSGNQLTLTVTKEEADAIYERRREEGFFEPGKGISSEQGWFYVIQFVPELDPKRVKLGFGVDVKDRLSQHRTSAPTAVCLKAWPCKRSWELAGIDALTAGCRVIANEVFEADDIQALLARGDAFFYVLPDPNYKIELANTSPLRLGRSQNPRELQ